MNDIMVDIETLSLHADGVVTQIALVYFDRYTGEVGKKLIVYPSAKEQVERGFSVMKETIDWWLKQDQTILTNIRLNEETVEEALNKISTFINSDVLVWNHASFDIPLIGNLFDSFEKERPWSFRNVRDIRTLVDLSRIDPREYGLKNKSHDALTDCLAQIEYCTVAFNKLKKGEL